MSDDDLPSLDFTLPGLIGNLPLDPVAADVAPFAHLPSALVDAATLHAAGDDLGAMRRLEAAIKSGEVRGTVEMRVWRALFEVLQTLERRQAFDALALTFSRRFERSPPAWTAEPVVQHKAHATTEGHAHVCLAQTLDASVGDVLKKALKLAQAGSVVRFDLVNLDAVDNVGATLLLRALAALKKAKKDYVLDAPQHLAAIVSAGLVSGKAENEALWLLLLELYQQASMQNEFEEAAVNYAVAFEKSPPSWEVLPVHDMPTVSASASASVSFPATAEKIALRGQMVGAGREEFAALEMTDRDEVVIDATALLRIDAASVKVLQQALGELGTAGRRIVIRGLSVLNAVFLELQGVARSAELVERLI